MVAIPRREKPDATRSTICRVHSWSSVRGIATLRWLGENVGGFHIIYIAVSTILPRIKQLI